MQKSRIYESQAQVKSPKDLKSKVDNYKSQIDNIYLIWKALEFEHLYDQVSIDSDDQFFILLEFINQIDKLKTEDHLKEKSKNQTGPTPRPDKDSLSPAEQQDLQNQFE